MATVKHLSYAGVSLLYSTTEHDAWLRTIHNPYDFLDLDPWNYDQPSMPAIPTPSIPYPPRFEFNKLYWPTGACRPAWFHCVVNDAKLAEIKAAVGTYAAPAALVFFDGITTVTAQMRMLPERPLNTTLGTSSTQGWIVTLTDERYFWYFRRGVLTAPASWANLFSQIAALLNVSVTVDTVATEYGTPSTKWALAYENANVMLDAAAAQVGQRVVVDLDGSVRTVNWETAQSESDALYAIAGSVVSGSYTPSTGIARTVPESVRVVFADVSTGNLAATPYVVENQLFPLGIAQYGDASGVPDFHNTVFADLAYTGSNGAAVAAYASAASIDEYGWMLSDMDVAYPGINPWAPTGWEDRIEWTMKLGGSNEPFTETTVRRGPWLTMLGGNYKAGYSGGGDTCCGSGPQTAIPVYASGTTVLQPSPNFTFTGTQFSDPNNTFTVYTILNYNNTTPNYTFQINVDGDGAGNPNFVFTVSPGGTSTNPNYTFTVYQTSVNHNYLFDNGGDPISINNTFTNPTTDNINSLFGDPTSGTGINTLFTIDPADGEIQSFNTTFSVDGGEANPVEANYVLDGSDTVAEYAGRHDFTGAEITATTQSPGDNSTLVATTAYVDAAVGGGATWTKITKTYTDFSAAAATNDIEIYSLAAKEVIHGVVVKNTVAFAGGAIAGYTMTVGKAGQTNKYISTYTMGPGSVSDTNFQANGGAGVAANPQPENFGSATSIRAYVASSGANLDQATGGSVDIYILLDTLP